MTHLLPLLPALACLAMMFGAGAIMWLGTKTPLRRVSAIARRAQSGSDGPSHLSRG
jgi:hypothetical protein